MRQCNYRFGIALAIGVAVLTLTSPLAQASVPRTRTHHARVSRVDHEVALMHSVSGALRSDRQLNGARVYTAAPGVVVLYGTVFDDQDRAQAEKAAQGVRGVHQVVNNLGTQTGEWADEENRLNLQLQQNGFNDAHVRVIGPEVYLSGQVTGPAEKDRAAQVVASVSKKQVSNMILVKPGPIFAGLF
jgi:osmotically-inducible protein OsmY